MQKHLSQNNLPKNIFIKNKSFDNYEQLEDGLRLCVIIKQNFRKNKQKIMYYYLAKHLSQSLNNISGKVLKVLKVCMITKLILIYRIFNKLLMHFYL
jgi:hypothetical protein